MSLGQAIVLLVALQRLGEAWLAQRNTAALLAEGGIEHGAGHYPAFILLHAAWLVTLFVQTGAESAVYWPLIGVYLVLQAGRAWVISALGKYWTTRVITVPGAPLIAAGPYRYLRHPNYVIVAGEIALLPLAFGAWITALVFSAANALLLWHRIRIEERALAPRRASAR